MNNYSLSIGLLGGSFNPAHSGHLHISREALKRLRLDAVWWLVAPQNPLKEKSEMADYATRLRTARHVAAAEKRIVVTDMEQRLRTYYTIDTLRLLKRRYPRTRFVWLMGADNLAGFHRWKRWCQIFSLVPVAIFDRAPYSHSSLRARAALRNARFRIHERRLSAAFSAKLPAWSYIAIPRDPTSATQIRIKCNAKNSWKSADFKA